ncbi:hypothetical protein ACTXT7_001842 [Hymenolepis weldensis]
MKRNQKLNGSNTNDEVMQNVLIFLCRFHKSKVNNKTAYSSDEIRHASKKQIGHGMAVPAGCP